MKTKLTKEESAHLISLGVPKEKASIKHIELTLEEYRVFNLTDLLEILPKEIEGENYVEYLRIGFTEDRKWRCNYTFYEDYFYGEELIDSLYELCVWCLENGYLKFEKGNL